MKNLFRLLVSSSLLLVLVSVSANNARAQAPPDPLLRTANGQVYRKPVPTNGWWLTPTPEQPPSGTPTDMDRGRLSDQWAGGKDVLDVPQTYSSPVIDGSFGHVPEIPLYAGEIALTATFSSAHAVLSPSRKSIYTVFNLQVDRVFTSDAASKAIGQSIELVESGGTVRLKSGRVVTINFAPRPFSLQLGHRYMFFIKRMPVGDYFDKYGDWELRDGVAVPDSGDTNQLAQDGESHLSGMKETDFVQAIEKALSALAPSGGL